MAELPAGALALSDLGYFSLDRLQRQGQQGSFWLTRAQAGTRVIMPDDQSWALSDWLATQGAASRVDVPIRLGAAHQLPCRLLAVRVEPQVADERQRQLHVEARRRGQPVSQERLVLADWTVYATNVPAAQLSLEQAWAWRGFAGRSNCCSSCGRAMGRSMNGAVAGLGAFCLKCMPNCSVNSSNIRLSYLVAGTVWTARWSKPLRRSASTACTRPAPSAMRWAWIVR